MALDILGYRNKWKDFYGNMPLEDVAKDAYERGGYKKQYADFDTFKKETGIDADLLADADERKPFEQKLREGVSGVSPVGLVKSLGQGLAEGLTTELPSMFGGAVEFAGSYLPGKAIEETGKSIKNWAEEKRLDLYGPEQARTGLERIIYEGSKMLAPSVLPGGIVGTIARGAKGVGALYKAGKVVEATKAAKSSINIASGSVAGLFGLSQAQGTRDNAELRAKELEAQGDYAGAQEAREAGYGIAPIATGAIEAAGEYLGTKYLGKLLGLDKIAAGRRGADKLMKDLLKTIGVEVGTEIGQQGLEAAVEKYSGIRPSADPVAEAIDVIGPTVFMTLLTGGLAGAANATKGGKTDDESARYLDNLKRGAIVSMAIHEGMKTGQFEGDPFTKENALELMKAAQENGIFTPEDIDRFHDRYPALKTEINDVLVDSLKDQITQTVQEATGLKIIPIRKTEKDVPPEVGEPVETPPDENGPIMRPPETGGLLEAGETLPQKKTEYDTKQTRKEPMDTESGASPVTEIPVDQIKLSKDVKQFKEGANEAGVVAGQEIKGEEYRRTPYNPIVLWKRNNGDLEVITGRHRLELAKRIGEETIPAQILNESDGFTAQDALTFDAEQNILDNQGSEYDYANYFRNTKIDEGTARARGLLRGKKESAAFLLGKSATDQTFDAFFRQRDIGFRKAAAIAKAAPNNERLQVAGRTFAYKNPHANDVEIENFVHAISLAKESPKQEQGDLFGFDDSAIQTAEIQAKKAAAIMNRLRRDSANINAAIRGDGKLELSKEGAKEYGIKNPKSKEQLKAAREKIQNEIGKWEKWYVDPELVKQLADLPGAETVTAPSEPPAAPAIETPAKGLTYDQFSAAYRQAWDNSNKYNLDEVGHGIYVDEMAKLADENPEYLERFEAEEEAKAIEGQAAKASEAVIDTLNPTSGVFTNHTPQERMAMKLGDNITTLDKTMEKAPGEEITVYRGAEGQDEIKPGDFVTTSEKLAKDYAGTGKVLSKKVKLSDVLDDKTEPLGEEYIYRPTEKPEPHRGRAVEEKPKVEKPAIEPLGVEDKVNAFVAKLNPMQKGRVLQTLNSKIRYNDVVMTVKEEVEKHLAEGYVPTIKEFVDEKALEKAREERRAIYSDGNQNIKAKRVKELDEIISNPPQKTSYRLTNEDGTFDEIGKTAYDYAKFIMPGEKKADAEEEGYSYSYETSDISNIRGTGRDRSNVSEGKQETPLDTSRPPGAVFQPSVVGREKIGSIKVAGKKVEKPSDAAQIASQYLRKYPDEHLLSIVLDKNSKVLHAYRHAIGLMNQTLTSSSVIIGEALNTPKAKSIVVAHNHPSQTTAFSREDIRFRDNLVGLARSSGIDVRDFMTVTKKNYFSSRESAEGLIPEITERVKIPVLGRVFETIRNGERVSTPGEAIVVAQKLIPQGGTLLFDSGNTVVGTIDTDNYSVIRGEKQAALLREIEKRNVVGLIVCAPTRTVSSREAANLAKFANAADRLRLLDIIDSTGSFNEGGKLAGGVETDFYSVRDHDTTIKKEARDEGRTAADDKGKGRRRDDLVSKNAQEHARKVDVQRSSILQNDKAPARLRRECKEGRGIVHDPDGYSDPEFAEAKELTDYYGIDLIPVTDTSNNINALIKGTDLFLNMQRGAMPLIQAVRHELSHFIGNKKTQSQIDTSSEAYKEYKEQLSAAYFNSPFRTLPDNHVLEEYAADLESGVTETYGVRLSDGMKAGETIAPLQTGKVTDKTAPRGQLEDRGAYSVAKKSDTFYSQLIKTVTNKIKEMPAKIQSIPKWLERQNVKPAEMKWMGVEQWLKDNAKDGVIDKQKFADFLKSNQIEIKEGIKGQGEILDKDIKIIDEDGNYVLVEISGEVDTTAIYDKNNENVLWSQSQRQGYENIEEAIESDDFEYAEDEFNERIQDAVMNRQEIDQTKFSKWQLPGGKNYREILFVMPGLDYQSAHWSEKGVLAHVRVNDRFAIDNTPSNLMESESEKSTSDSFAAHSETLTNLVETEAFISKGLSGLNIEDRKTVSASVFAASSDPKILRRIVELIPINMMDKLVTAKFTPEQFFSNQTMLTDSLTLDPDATVRFPNTTMSAFVRSVANLVAEEVDRSSEFVGLPVQRGMTPSTSDIRSSHKGKYTLFIEEIQSDLHQEGKKKGYRRNIPLKYTSLPDGFIVQKSGEKYQGNYVVLDTTQYDFPVAVSTAQTEYDAIRKAIDQLNEYDEDNLKNRDLVPPAPFAENWHELLMKRMLRYAAENGYDKIAWTTGEQQAERYDLSKQVSRVEAYDIGGGLYSVFAYDHDGNHVIREMNVPEKDLPGLVGKELAEKIVNSEYRRSEFSGLDLKVGGEGMKSFYDNLIPGFMNRYVKQWGTKVGTTEINTGGNAVTAPSVDITPAMKQDVLFKGQEYYSIRAPKAPPTTRDPKILDLYLKDEADAIFQTIMNKLRPKHMTWLETVLKSPEWFDHPQIQKIVRLFMRIRNEMRHQVFNDLNMADDIDATESTITEAGKALKNKGLSFADRLAGKESAEYKMLSDFIDYFDTEAKRNPNKSDDENLADCEAYMRKNGATDDVVRVWRLYRQSYDKALELQTRQLREMIAQIIEEAAFRGESPDASLAELKDALKYALAEMETWKGYYAPRIREAGDWKVQAYKKHGPLEANREYYRDHRGSELSARRLANKLRREGWTVYSVSQVEKLPEAIYQDVKAASAAKLIDNALGKVKENSTAIAAINSEVLRAVADEIRARGFRSHMIHRKEGAVIKGYIEDPIKRHLLYANQLAGGLSKAYVARRAIEELLGQKVNGKHVGGIDPVEDPKAYEVATNYIEEQLRNLDASDRIIGLAKSIATFKFLGFNIRSLAVNMTAIVTTAPPAIHQYAMGGKGSIARILKELGRAGGDYGAFMAGRKLDNANEQALLEDSERKGWTDAQYMRDALGTIERTHSRAWAAVMDASMYLFGKSEQWNRGTTMLAAYRLARKRGLDHATAAEAAKEASDRAHGIYGRATLPMWAQGANPAAKIGQMLYIYSKFSHNYLQMLYDLGFKKRNIKGALFAFLSPIVVAGGAALPFKDVIFKVLGAILSVPGWEKDPEKWVWDQIREHLGMGAEKVGRHGLTGAAGVDISGSLSIGVGVPKGMIDLSGAIGGVAEDVIESTGALKRKEYARAAEYLLPTGLANPIRAYREAKEGVTTRRNYPVFDESGRMLEPTAAETVTKVLGFRSSRQATLAERTWEAKRQVAEFTDQRKDLYQRYRSIMASRDRKKYAELIKDVRAFNRRVREMGLVAQVPLITSESLRRQEIRMQKPTKRQAALLQ